MIVEATLPIFQDASFCNNINLSQIKISWKKKKYIKNRTKKILYTGKNIYTDSLRALHEKFNATSIEGVSLTVFYSYKPFYVTKPTKKEKESCLCIVCLNPHLVLKSIPFFNNLFR